MTGEEPKATAQHVYEIRLLSVPRIALDFRQAVPLNKPLTQAFRVEVVITSDHDIALLFGNRLTSEDVIAPLTPCIDLTVEVVTQIHFGAQLGKISHFKEIPYAANILATLYPFIREKVYTCFADNHYPFFLGPLNLVALVEQFGDVPAVMRVTDNRPTADNNSALLR